MSSVIESELESLRALYPALSDYEEDVAVDLFELAELVEHIQRRIRELAAASGMPPHHFFVLEHLALHRGSSPLSEVLVATALPKQSATSILDRLERDELVERRRDEKDRRRIRVVLTRRGKSVVKAALRPFYDTLLGAMAEVPARDRRASRRGLRAFRGALASDE